MEKLSAFFYRIASWKTLLLGLVLYIIFPAFILKNAEEQINAFAGETIGPIDLLMFEYNPEKILKMVATYGEEGRAYYAQGEMTADLAYPLVYAFLFGVILSLLYRNKPYQPFRYVNLLPVLCMLLDFAENICIIYLLKSYPEQSLTIASVCLIFNNLKWIVFVVLIGFVLYGLIRLLLHKRK